MNVRGPLWWALAGTSALSAAALWIDGPPAVVPPRGGGPAGPVTAQTGEASPASTPPAPDPAAMEPRATFAPARQDLFAVRVQAAPTGPVAAPALLAAPTPMPAAVAPAPRLAARILGRVQDPEGQTRVFLADGASIVEARAGARLPDGYVVDDVKLHESPQGPTVEVRLTHPATPDGQTLRMTAGGGG